MTSKEHPLAGNSLWRFNQPELGFACTYTALPLGKSGPAREFKISSEHTCRETVVYNTRAALRNHLTNTVALGNIPWRERKRALIQGRRADLKDSKPAKLRLRWGCNCMDYFPGGRQFPAETFFRVCDTVLGPVCVLLSPRRSEGDWWKASMLASPGGKIDCHPTYAHWGGSDNWFLAHPATVAIATGLYRQCFHLCGAGIADQIFDAISEEEIKEVMSTGSQRLALQATKATRPFIEVPVGRNGFRGNYAFAKGFWRRLIRLQRAIRRGGYEAAMGQTFEEGWGILDHEATEWSGLYGFWGDEEDLTDKHRHLMKAGEPRRRRKVGGKSATQVSR